MTEPEIYEAFIERASRAAHDAMDDAMGRPRRWDSLAEGQREGMRLIAQVIISEARQYFRDTNSAESVRAAQRLN